MAFMSRAFKRRSSWIAIGICLIVPFTMAAATLQSRTLQAWDSYVRLTEARIDNELENSSGFLRADFMKPADSAKVWNRLRSGKVYSEGHELQVQGGMIHDWYGAIFIPDIKVDSLVRWIQDYDHHSRYFKEVERSKLLSRENNTFLVYLRITRSKLVTVHYNTNHKAVYRSHGAGRVSSRSVALRIAEIENAGTPSETEEPVGVDSGFMWRLNSYWRFQEQDGGVVVECESVSLSRSIPYGLGWLIREYVESVPRESLESVLTSIRDGVAGPH